MRILIILVTLALIGLGLAQLFLNTSSDSSLVLNNLDVNAPSNDSGSSHLEALDQSGWTPQPQKEANTMANDSDLKAREQALLANLPASLRGTQVNGGFQVDDQGHLILSSNNRDFFEYFLTSLGEEDLDSILSRISGLIELQLQSPAKEEALELLSNYIDLKRALVDLEQQVGGGLDQYGQSSLAQHQARLDMLSTLRQQYLGTEAANAFYGESEDFDRYMLAKMAINSDQQRSPEEQAEARLKLMEEAPASIKPQLEEEYTMARMQHEVTQLKDNGGTAEEIYQVRAQVLGEEAAQRLQDVDQRQADWDARYQHYRSQRQAIESDGLSPEATQEQVQSLQKQLFNDQEQRRVQALDRINS